MADRFDPFQPEDRVDEPTPNGGAYSIAYRVLGEIVEIVEFDKNDKAIFRTYAETPLRGNDVPALRPDSETPAETPGPDQRDGDEPSGQLPG